MHVSPPILCLNTSFAISSHRDSASIILYIWLVTAVVFVSVFKHCWLMAGSRKNSSGARKSHGIFCNQESGNPVGTDKALCFRPVHQSVCVCVCVCVSGWRHSLSGLLSTSSLSLRFSHFAFGLFAFMPSVLLRCWLGDRKSIQPEKN